MKRGARAARRYPISFGLVIMGALAPAVAAAYPDAVGRARWPWGMPGGPTHAAPTRWF